MHGAAPRALLKSSRTFDSDSPNHIESSSGPLTEMKLDLTSLAIACDTRATERRRVRDASRRARARMCARARACETATGFYFALGR
eukprot:2824416-Pleurochrysis_carterae.AAC.1